MAESGRAVEVLAWQRRLDAVEVALEVVEAERSAAHEVLLRRVLELAAVLHGAPFGAPGLDREAFVIGQLGLLLRCSEARSGELLRTARGLVELPGGLEALGCGLLTVEQAGTVVRALAVLELPDRLAVWRRLQTQLVEDADSGTVRPPARLAEVLRRWVLQADADAVQRRQRTRAERRVDYRRRDDGLVDLTISGIEPLHARAVLSRIARFSTPWAGDERTADQRRADTAVDLLLGRVGSCTGGRAACGCLPGEGAPCGVEVMVLLPVGAALGTTDDVAELAGHGPLEHEQVEAVLRAAPRLHPVWVDDEGVPVAMGTPVRLPRSDGTAAAGDSGAAGAVLQGLAGQPPPAESYPRHPHDHDPTARDALRGGAPPPDSCRRRPEPRSSAAAGRRAAGAADPSAAAADHPTSQPGTYRPGPRLRRLIGTRAPRCEWAGCGWPSASCDGEHDRAWPHGPTCACNLGPLCRRHHRLKQLLLALGGSKTRGERSLVTWSSPTGRSWTGPAPHQPLGRTPARPRTCDPWAGLSDLEMQHEQQLAGDLPDDPTGPPLLLDTDTDAGPDEPDHDLTGDRLLHDDTRWDLDLADHTGWLGLAGV